MELRARYDRTPHQPAGGALEARARALSRPIILCIDDDSDLLTILRLFLGAHGFEVIVAHNAAQALQLSEERRPDLIVTDCAMPGMSGLELCRTLRDRSETRDLPIILYSGRDLCGDDLGLFDRYILKPADLDALAKTIRGLLSGSLSRKCG